MTIDLNRLSDSTQTYKFIPLFTVSYFQSENLEIPGYYKGRQFRHFLCFSFQEYYRQHQQNVSCLTWSHSLLCSKCFLCSVCLRRESHQFFCALFWCLTTNFESRVLSFFPLLRLQSQSCIPNVSLFQSAILN